MKRWAKNKRISRRPRPSRSRRRMGHPLSVREALRGSAEGADARIIFLSWLGAPDYVRVLVCEEHVRRMQRRNAVVGEGVTYALQE